MSGLASPPAWAWALAGLDAGAKLCLLTMLTWDAYDNEGEIFVFPRRSSIAMRSGQTESAVKKQVAKLTKAKHIARAERTIKGVLRQGWVIEPGTTGADAAASRGRGDHKGRGPQGPTPTPTVPDPGDYRGRTRGPQGPHTLQDSFSDPELNVGEAREREPLPPPPEPSSRPWTQPAPQTADEQAIVWGSQASAQAQLERERAAKLDETHALLDACIVDAWAAQVREASPGAHYLLDQTATSTHKASYSALMRQARASYGDQGVLEALRKWELADYTERPPAKALWHSRWQSWVEGVLDIKPERSKPEAGAGMSASGRSAFEAAMRLQVVK